MTGEDICTKQASAGTNCQMGNIIFSDFLGESLEYMLGKGYKGEKVMNADCCGY